MPPLRRGCRGIIRPQLFAFPFHKAPQIAHKELGVQLSKEGSVPTAMVIMERRDVHLKKSVGQPYFRLLALMARSSDFSTADTRSGLLTRWRLAL